MKVIQWFAAISMILVLNVGLVWGQEVAGTSRVFIMDGDQNNKALVYQKPDIQWIKYESLKTGINSKGHELATLYAIPTSNLQLACFRIAKGGFIDYHKSPGIYPMYVAAGKGTVDFRDGTKVDIKTGDVMVQMPNIDRGFTNTGDDQLVIVYIRVLPVLQK
jgi:quercetin dioxygenase-like cupin family protein